MHRLYDAVSYMSLLDQLEYTAIGNGTENSVHLPTPNCYPACPPTNPNFWWQNNVAPICCGDSSPPGRVTKLYIMYVVLSLNMETTYYVVECIKRIYAEHSFNGTRIKTGRHKTLI